MQQYRRNTRLPHNCCSCSGIRPLLRYYCVDCLITHYCGSCTEATLANSEQPESNKRRRCKVWAPAKTRSGRNVRKRNKNDDTDKASTAKKNTAESSGLLENLNDLGDGFGEGTRG